MAKGARFLRADNEYSVETARMRRLFSDIVERTRLKARFLMLRLICRVMQEKSSYVIFGQRRSKTNQRIRTGWSWPSFLTYRSISNYRIYTDTVARSLDFALCSGGRGLSQVISKRQLYQLLFRLALSMNKIELGIRTGMSGVSIMWLDGISCLMSGAWYFNEAVLSSLPHTDTVATFPKDCWKPC